MGSDSDLFSRRNEQFWKLDAAIGLSAKLIDFLSQNRDNSPATASIVAAQIRYLSLFVDEDLRAVLVGGISPFAAVLKIPPDQMSHDDFISALERLKALLEGRRELFATRSDEKYAESGATASKESGAEAGDAALWETAEKLYKSSQVRGLLLVVALAIAIAAGGAVVIGGQTINLMQNVDKARDSAEAKMSAARQDIDKAKESAETKIRTITESAELRVTKESQDQVAALRDRATAINSQLTRAEREVEKLNAGSETIKKEIVEKLKGDLAARESSLKDELLNPLIEVREKHLTEIGAKVMGARKALEDLASRTGEENDKLIRLGPALGRLSALADQADKIDKALSSISADQDAARNGRIGAEQEAIKAVQQRQATEYWAKEAERSREQASAAVRKASEEAAAHNRTLGLIDKQAQELEGKLSNLDGKLNADIAAEERRLRAVRERIAALDKDTQLPPTKPSAPIPPIKQTTFEQLTGEELKQIQRRLAQEGMEVGKIDGKAGPKLTAAIRAFQRKTGAEITGKPTPEQIAALLKPS